MAAEVESWFHLIQSIQPRGIYKALTYLGGCWRLFFWIPCQRHPTAVCAVRCALRLQCVSSEIYRSVACQQTSSVVCKSRVQQWTHENGSRSTFSSDRDAQQLYSNISVTATPS
ncbi:hypothetical protein TgHK011_009415 [Trichoderma gracile]|nr:hypothetical protein TgHK011_009415 [Trichoderma gracile]